MVPAGGAAGARNITCYELRLSGASGRIWNLRCSNLRLTAASSRIWNLPVFESAADHGSEPRSFAGWNIGMFHGRTVGGMRVFDVQSLFDFTYWGNRQVLDAAAVLSVDDFTRPETITYRNLRGTLVHTLDVEMSWRRRLRAEPKEIWDASLSVEDYPTVDALGDHWARDEVEMRDWLAALTDDDLVAVQDLGNNDRFPLWYYLVHIVTHSEQQRRDVQIILAHLGHEPPDLEFLYYADALVEAD